MAENTSRRPYDPEQAPPDWPDPVIDVFIKDVDRSLLRENLKLTVQERFDQYARFMQTAELLKEAGRKLREAKR